MSLAEARRRVERMAVRRLAGRWVPTRQALGRLSAAELRAPLPLPRYPVSAMDGYAIRLGRRRSPGPFRVVGAPTYPASRGRRRSLRTGEAAYITTGARLPPGADAVVRIERVRYDGRSITLTHPARPGQDIGPPGESVPAREVLLRRGEPIGPAHVALLLAVGVRKIPTLRLRVTLLPIGDELEGVRAARGRAGVTDYMSPLIAALLGTAEVRIAAPLPDEPAAVARALRAGSRRSDLLITLGGSSAGDRDVTKPAVRRVGRLLFEGVAVNVLKRGSVGRVGEVPVLVLPGQVVSAATVFHEHGLHLLSRLIGRDLRVYERVPLAEPLAVDHRMDSTYLFARENGRARPLPWGVARLSELPRANAFGILERGRRYRAGETVLLQRFLWAAG